MLIHTDLKKGVKFILDGQAYEVLDYSLVFKGRGKSVVQAKIRNLITGSVISRSFHVGETFEEAEISILKIKFLYSSQGRYFFCEEISPSKRIALEQNQIGSGVLFLKQNQTVDGLVFKDKIINIDLPIKVQLKVVEAPPGLKADRSESGTKQVVLETGAKINTPLFVKEDDIVEVNTESGEYIRRVND